MNRPANPYRDEHRRLEAAGNAAAGVGDYYESARLWREASLLKRKGIAEVEAQIRERKKDGHDTTADA